MASADGTSPSSDRRGGLRRLLPLRKDFISPKPAADRSPLIVPSPPSPPSTAPPPPGGKKKGFAAAAFRGLGCTSASSSQAVAPAVAPAAAAVVRSSADWQGKRPRRRRAKQKKERRGQAGGGDVWCTPGIPFAADASVDCVVSHHQMTGRGRVNGKRIHREWCGVRGGQGLPCPDYNRLDPIAVAVTATVGLTAILSTKGASRFNYVTCIIHLTIVVFVVVAGLTKADPKNVLSDFAPFGARGLFSASAVLFFTYVGFDAVSTMAEETKNLARDIPLGLIGAMSITTICYCLLALTLCLMQPYSRIDVNATFAVVAEAKEADDVVVAEAEEDVELQAEGAVETLAGAKDLEGDEGGGSGGEVLGMAATASQRGKNQREEAAACSSASEDGTRPMVSREREQGAAMLLDNDRGTPWWQHRRRRKREEKRRC